MGKLSLSSNRPLISSGNWHRKHVSLKSVNKKQAASGPAACPIALPSVVSERTSIEFFIIPKYHPVFDKGLRRGKRINFSQTKFEVV